MCWVISWNGSRSSRPRFGPFDIRQATCLPLRVDIERLPDYAPALHHHRPRRPRASPRSAGPCVPARRSLRFASPARGRAAPSCATPACRSGRSPTRPRTRCGPSSRRRPGCRAEEANAVVIGEVFGRLGAGAALPGVEAMIESWRPDVVVRESYEFASVVAAERAGIPHVRVATGLASTEEWVLGHAGKQPVAEIRASPLHQPDAPGARRRARLASLPGGRRRAGSQPLGRAARLRHVRLGGGRHAAVPAASTAPRSTSSPTCRCAC